ncbi:MAG TPA: M48 family peptidase [Methylothermaceae bacterium]|nr:M48 family peptidase [Methylothermaceae bacterium]
MLVRVLLLWLCALATAAAKLPPLPDMGAPSDRILSPTDERRLGQAFFRNLHQHVQVSDDPMIQDYIASLGSRLTGHSDMAGRPFHFFVVMEPEINAFAGPAGYIGVHSGLILATRSESELASVLAHEIAHVTQNHLKRAFAAAKKLSIPMAAAMLAAILVGTQSPEAAQAAIIAIQAGSLQQQINFTRAHEQEADRIGLQILADSGFDPRSMPAFFERLQQSTRLSGGRHIPEFLRTHPVTTSRIADTRARATAFPYRQYTDSLAYLLVKSKLKVIGSKDPARLISWFQQRLLRGTAAQKAAARYGLALSYQALHRLPQSRRLLEDLLRQFPEQPQFVDALAQVELALGETEAALQRYRLALTHFPASTMLQLTYAQALLQSGRFQEARQWLLQLKANGYRLPVIYKHLSRAYGGMGKTAEAQRYLAEYYYAIGDLKQAIRYARIALKMARGDRILTAVTQERLRFFQREEKARKR